MSAIVARFRLLREIVDRPWPRRCFSIWAVVAAWDTFVSQFIPAETAKDFPKAYQVVAMTYGWLSWQSWFWIGLVIFALVCLEYGHRHKKRFEDAFGLSEESKQNGKRWSAVSQWGPWFLILGGPLVGAIWLYFSSPQIFWGTSERISDQSVKISSKPETSPKVPTAAADIPKKLAIIDGFVTVLRDQLEPAIQKGMQLSTGRWWNDTMTGKSRELREETVLWRNTFANLNHNLRTLSEESPYFPDIQALVSPSYENIFNPKMEKFVGAVANLGDEKWNAERLKFFMGPIAEECYKEIGNVESWRREKIRAASELRKTLSQ